MNLTRCRTCLYPTTKPDLIFDATGQCSACVSFAKRPTINWSARRRELDELLDRHHGEVIVPSSGGKDSTAIAIRLKAMGARVTAVTATTCHPTPWGRKNIANLARHVRTIEVTANRTVRAKLNRLALELVGDISWPEHATIFSVPFEMARDLGVTLVMYGENPQAEYGGPPGSDEAKQMTRRWVTEFGGFLGLRAADFIGMEGLTEEDMRDYASPADYETGPEVHFLGAYQPWDSHGNAELAREFGFTCAMPSVANWWDFENLDNAQTGIHDRFCWLKYGFGRATAQLSVDLRHRLVRRDFALRWVEARDGLLPDVYAAVHLDEVLDNIGLSRPAFNLIAARYRNQEIHGDASDSNHPRHAGEGAAPREGSAVRQ